MNKTIGEAPSFAGVFAEPAFYRRFPDKNIPVDVALFPFLSEYSGFFCALFANEPIHIGCKICIGKKAALLQVKLPLIC